MEDHRTPPGKPSQVPSAADLDAALRRGLSLHQQGKLAEAKAVYEAIVTQQPRHFDALNLLGAIAAQGGHYGLAAELIGKAIDVYPAFAPAHNNRGIALFSLGRREEALADFDKAVSIDPGYAEAHNNAGDVLHRLGRSDEALARYDKAIALKRDYADAYRSRGIVLCALGRLSESLASYDKSLTLKPDDAEGWNNRGLALINLERPEEALASYDRALSLKPDIAQIHNNRGIALVRLKRLEEALASYDKALALKPDNAETWNNLGNVLRELRRHEEAVTVYEKATSLKPDYAEAHYNRGNALLELRRLNEALAAYDEAIALKPDHWEAFNNRGCTLRELRRSDEELVAYDKTIALKPDCAEAFSNRGYALRALNRLEEARDSFAKALSLKSDQEFLLGMLLHTKMNLCEWATLSMDLHLLEEGISRSERLSVPFPALALLDRPDLHKMAARVFAEAKHPGKSALGPLVKRPDSGKIRIGYYSANFHNHAVAYLIAELLESHDPNRFDLYGFSFGPDKHDEMRKRVSSALHNFIDIREKSDREVANLSRELGIDIAVDLMGHTQDSRPGLFVERCAPIQAGYLGYPGTVGTAHDYIIADKTVIPRESHADFFEKVVYLPYSFLVNDSQRKISNRAFTRQEMELPAGGFVFCCFNNHYKILPATFDGWMRILKAVEHSVLWLPEKNPTAMRNLRLEAQARGVNGTRLIFAKRMDSLAEHLARHRLADLFIDTLPYNAHTTACDALWSGLPVLTCPGRSFASRVAASLLTALELPELIADSQEAYEAKAIALATRADQLQGIREKLERNRLTSPLFNGRLSARHLEAAYEAMYARYLSGQQPDTIEVQAR